MSVSLTVEDVTIDGPVGSLEGLLNTPDGPIERVALICHPHPLHGGTMHNNVVYQVARALRERGLAVLRFNFRGVGRSAGTYDEGRGERDDVRAACDELLRRFPGRPCWLGGFSFGSRVGLEVGVGDERVSGLIGVGMPVNTWRFAFLEASRKPLVAIHGSADEFGASGVIEGLVANRAAPSRLEMIDGTGHFFTGRFDELRAAVDRAADFLVAHELGSLAEEA